MDLKNIDLKNIKLEDLKAKLQNVDKKTLIKFGSGFAAIIIFLIGYYAILNPIVNQKKQLFSDKELKQTEIQTMNSEISTMKKAIKNKTPEFKESSKLFHTKAEVEGLYDSLSKFAGVNGLIISKIEKGNPKPVLKQGVANTQTTESLDVNNIRYYKIPVTYEIKGNFLGYIKFKRALAKSKKMLNFDKELISLVQNDSTGGIVAKGELTIVGLPNEFY
jgi:Tfp pilus assembly protein PilO|tara:strand:- start:1730 stop:2386 length:657 start_codon:yes stop_codon:yes gene_type:complete